MRACSNVYEAKRKLFEGPMTTKAQRNTIWFSAAFKAGEELSETLVIFIGTAFERPSFGGSIPAGSAPMMGIHSARRVLRHAVDARDLEITETRWFVGYRD